jgi:hypothetical protein
MSFHDDGVAWTCGVQCIPLLFLHRFLLLLSPLPQILSSQPSSDACQTASQRKAATANEDRFENREITHFAVSGLIVGRWFMEQLSDELLSFEHL